MSEETAKQEAPEAPATPDPMILKKPPTPTLLDEAFSEVRKEVRDEAKAKIKKKLRDLVAARKIVQNLEIELRALAAEAGE